MGPVSLRVGELAGRCGVSVRTLHHYDEIGLLRPTLRTEAGHRLYGEAEVRRLQSIVSLRELGLALEEIAGVLDRPDGTFLAVIERHRRALVDRIERQRRLVERLASVAERLRGAEDVSVEEVISTIEQTVLLGDYYTEDQLAYLDSRRGEVGEDRIREVEAQWKDIFARLQEAREAGSDAGSPEVQLIARQAQGLVAEFTGGDAGVTRSLEAMYQAEGGSKLMAQRGWDVDPEVFELLSSAMARLKDD